MKIIFLDIDGVLNSDEYFDKISNLDIQGIEQEIDIEKVKLLKEAINETGAKVVLSSSWRYTRKGQQLKELLKINKNYYQLKCDSSFLLIVNKKYDNMLISTL